MMKPRVGLTVLTSSPMIFLTMVVLPALSRPLHLRVSILAVSDRCGEVTSSRWQSHSISILSSLSFSLAFLSMESIAASLASTMTLGTWALVEGALQGPPA